MVKRRNKTEKVNEIKEILWNIPLFSLSQIFFGGRGVSEKIKFIKTINNLRKLYWYISLNLSLPLSLLMWDVYSHTGVVFVNGPGDLGSIPGRVIPKTQKWYLMPLCLTLSIKRYGSSVKWSNTGERSSALPNTLV